MLHTFVRPDCALQNQSFILRMHSNSNSVPASLDNTPYIISVISIESSRRLEVCLTAKPNHTHGTLYASLFVDQSCASIHKYYSNVCLPDGAHLVCAIMIRKCH